MKEVNFSKKSDLTVFGLSEVQSWKPSSDFSTYLPSDWRGNAIDILKVTTIPFQERLWVVCRSGLISERGIRLFANWSARQVEDLMTDERSLNALNVADQYVNGKTSLEAIRAARYASYQAVCTTDFEGDDTSPPWSAAENAARVAAWTLSESSIWSAARAIARASMSAQAAAHDKDRIALVTAQCIKLIEILATEGSRTA